jgi:hypothetical protein
MAQKLYAAPSAALTREGVRVFADKLHLDAAAFARCLDAPETKAALDADSALFNKLGVRALPYTFIGPRAVAGYSPDLARDVSMAVMEGDRPSLPVPWMFAAAAAIAAALVAVTLRLAPRAEPAG